MNIIPKRKFALEEKDLAVEADENNKIAEEKENRFVKKIQDEALNEIKHLPTDKVLDRLPEPTGWRLLILPYKGQGKQKVEFYYQMRQWRREATRQSRVWS